MQRVFTQTFGVVGSIIEKDGKILLVREAKSQGPDAGKWNQPAGWIDVGEDPFEAAQRETKEETGYDFTPTEYGDAEPAKVSGCGQRSIERPICKRCHDHHQHRDSDDEPCCGIPAIRRDSDAVVVHRNTIEKSAYEQDREGSGPGRHYQAKLIAS